MSALEVKIYTTFDSLEADQVIATLQHYGIPSVKRMEGAGQYIGILMGHMTTHAAAVRELRNGRKYSHWSWWEIPQNAGLGRTYTSQQYAIRDLAEAKAYLRNETLRKHLLEICEALLSLETSDARRVMGSPDDLKLRSCMTLFSAADPECKEFQAVLDKFYGGRKDGRTIAILKRQKW